MSRPTTRGAIASLAAAGLLGSLAVAPSAQASTLWGCVKKDGSAHIYTAKPKKCKKGEKRLSWNSEGPAGRNGTNGTNGANGLAGAVAGFSALQSSSMIVNGTMKAVPGLEKTLPAGSFIVSASIEGVGYAESNPSATLIECALSDSSAPSKQDLGAWGSPFFLVSGTQYIAYGMIPMHLAVTSAVPHKVSVSCKEQLGVGSVREDEVIRGVLVAVQTSANS